MYYACTLRKQISETDVSACLRGCCLACMAAFAHKQLQHGITRMFGDDLHMVKRVRHGEGGLS